MRRSGRRVKWTRVPRALHPLGLVQCACPPTGGNQLPPPCPCPLILPDVIVPSLASCPGQSELTLGGECLRAVPVARAWAGVSLSCVRPGHPTACLPLRSASGKRGRAAVECGRPLGAPALCPSLVHCGSGVVGVVQAFPITGRRRLSNSPRGVVYKCSVSSWDRAPWD